MYNLEGSLNGRIHSLSGRLLLEFQGNEYVKHSIYNGRIYWRCRSYQKGCRVRVLTRWIDGHLLTYRVNNKICHINHE